ncbi:MAG: nucleoside 2-deoxyribosyltransferase [Pseudonocardiaceae bacterium]
MHSVPRVFLAAPFAQWLSEDGLVDPTWRDRLSMLRQGFLDAGMPVFSAHHNERWGAGWLPAEVCVPNDFRAMETCDVVCAYLGTPASAGVCIELGWASAMRKPILLVLDRGIKHSQMIKGLTTVTRVRELVLAGGWTASATSEIFNATVELMEGSASRGRAAWSAGTSDECLGYTKGAQVFREEFLTEADR